METESERGGINVLAKPSGTGCVECLMTGGWWLHLRRCAQCGHIGCCDSSPTLTVRVSPRRIRIRSINPYQGQPVGYPQTGKHCFTGKI
jgi:hypothetical protein